MNDERSAEGTLVSREDIVAFMMKVGGEDVSFFK